MSSLMLLPEEILIIIIKQLDIKSVYNLYRTCGFLKNIVLMHGVIRHCNLSLNTLATPKSLQLDMIKQISGHLRVLNMCGVLNLTKSVLLPALSRMKSLKTLDVSHTDINISDMLDIYTNCPSIINITIDFFDLINITLKTVHDYQEVFKNLVNVHFIMRTRLIESPFLFLKKSSLDTLKFTLYNKNVICTREEIDVSFNHFCIFMVDHDNNVYQGSWTEVVPLFKLENIEYIILDYKTTYSVCTSALFKSFFSDNFKITSFLNFDVNRKMYGNVAIFIWNKKTTIFDGQFFFKLKQRIKQIFACELKDVSEQSQPLDIKGYCYEWFHIYPTEAIVDRSRKADIEPNFKKRRVVQSDYTLDYDKIFSDHKNIKLSIYISFSVNVTLSSGNDYLRKLTYLSLNGPVVRYSNEFFNILFRCCNKLVTLNIEASPLSSCWSSITRSIPLNQTLKNFRLVDKRIDFKTLFSCFTQCKSLENICIIDNSHEFNEIADLVIIYQCVNLYSLHIQAEIRKSTVSKVNAMNKNFLKQCSGRYINFVLKSSSSPVTAKCNPYLNVFKLTPIKPV